MKAGKTNDSHVAIFTIDNNYICLNAALAKCLLDAAFKTTDPVPYGLWDRLLSFSRAFQQLPTDTQQYLTPRLCPGPTGNSDFPDRDYEIEWKCPKRYFPKLVSLCVGIVSTL